MDLYDVMRTTAAVREFTADPLPDEVLHRILDNARFAPSGDNRQGAHVVVVRDGTTRERLARLNETAVRRYVAQTRAGESPWNSVHPPGPSAKEIAATGVPETFALAAVVPLDRPVKQLTKLKGQPVAAFVTRERFDGEPF